MEYFLSSFWAALELVGLYFFWRAFLEIKCSNRSCFIVFISAWIFSTVFLNIGIPDICEQAISFTMFIVISLICYHGSLFRKILFVILFYVLGAIIDSAILYGTCAVLGISLSELVWLKMTYVVVSTAIKLIIIFLSWLLFRMRRVQACEPIRQKWLLLTIPFPAVSLGMLAVVFYNNRAIGDLSLSSVIFSIMLAVANVAIIYLFASMEKSTSETKKLALLNQQMEIQTSSIIALEKNYRTQRQVTHEHKNQLQTIQALLLANEHDAAMSYIQQIQGTQTNRILIVDSHHPIIDAVLNHKYQQAQEHDIDVLIQVNDLSHVSIAADQLVVLLSNLLDNAIEACLCMPDHRIIQCSLILTDSLYLSVRNSSLPVKIKDNFIPSTKVPKEDHGYGLPHIDLILNQLSAEYALSYEDGWFEFAAEIPHNPV